MCSNPWLCRKTLKSLNHGHYRASKSYEWPSKSQDYTSKARFPLLQSRFSPSKAQDCLPNPRERHLKTRRHHLKARHDRLKPDFAPQIPAKPHPHLIARPSRSVYGTTYTLVPSYSSFRSCTPQRYCRLCFHSLKRSTTPPYFNRTNLENLSSPQKDNFTR